MKTQKLDAKFDGVIFKVKDGTIVPPDQYMVFLVKDRAFLNTVRFYREECARLGADQEHLQAVSRTIDRAEKWQRDNVDLMKVPDAAGDKLIG